ncbi:MAG: DNA primase [Dehalococcoidia bacterium]|nr:DNA primase [Dehalococcoidia bacterium]
MSVISEVKQRIDLVEFVSQYVTLQKTGRNFKGLCPFHSEKTPSFFVFPEQQTWHCFGACGTGGDVFSFLMRKENVDFSQALHILAERAGVALSSPERVVGNEDREKDELFQINELAAEYYHHLLLNALEGEEARNYLTRREVARETVEEFRLGFSPDAREGLKKYLRDKGYEAKDLVKAGLAVERKDGSIGDRFFNRLMFPICGARGKVTGFGARALGNALPKYINSPYTAVFDKSSNLYGIDRAISAIREKNSVVIVEGYMDALLLHQHGWKNVVAAMGTSLTEKQVAIIKKLTKHVFLALDADVAGEEAVLRGMEVISRSGDRKMVPIPVSSGLVKCESVLDAEIRVVALPQGKDPDEVIREGPRLWQNLVEQALPLLDFAIDTVLSKLDIGKAADKSWAIQKLLPLLQEVKDPLRRAQYVQKLAKRLKVSEAILLSYIKKSETVRGKRKDDEAMGQQFSHHLASSAIEEYCLALLFQYPELRQLSQDLAPEYFQHIENRELFVQWQRFPDISRLESQLDDSLSEHLYYLLHRSFPPPICQSNKERQIVLRDCILRLQEGLFRVLEREGVRSGQQLQEIFIQRARGIMK